MTIKKSTKVNATKLIRFDWAMKSILRNKSNFDILEGFLFALLKEEITIEQLLESESNMEEGLKFNRVDLLVHDTKGRKLIIEIQTAPESYYLQRLLFGTCKVIIDNINLGNNYSQIVKIISISILYFNLGLGDDYVYVGNTEFIGLHTSKVLKRRKAPATRLPSAENVFPEYYLINVKRFKDEVRDHLDEWIYLFKNSATKENFNAPNIDKAAHKLDILRMNPEERRKYEYYINSLMIQEDVLETARLKGVAEGKAEGKAEGEIAGQILVLKRQLIRRFCQLPDWAEERINMANTAQLEKWAEGIFEVQDIESIFKIE